MEYKIRPVNRGVLAIVLLVTGLAYAAPAATGGLNLVGLLVVGYLILECWKLWLGFGIFRRLSGNRLIGFVYLLGTLVSFVPGLSFVVNTIGNYLAAKAVAQKLGKKPSKLIYFGWFGLFHLQGLLNEAARETPEQTSPSEPLHGQSQRSDPAFSSWMGISAESLQSDANHPHGDRPTFAPLAPDDAVG